MKRLVLIASVLAATLSANSRLALSSPVACGSLVAHDVSAELHRDSVARWSMTAAECLDKPSSLPPSATWGRQGTLQRHVSDHGADFGVHSADDYARSASKFFQQSQLDRLPTKVDSKGVIRVYDSKTNTFGAFNPDGTTRTFYKPDPSKHGYPTNLEYWNAQPGGASWSR